MAAPSEYVAEGDGFDHQFDVRDPIIRAAANGDIAEVRRQLSLGLSLAAAMYVTVCHDEVASVEALLEAGGTAEVNARASFGWTFLGMAAAQGHVKLARVLLAAGADPDRRVLNDYLSRLRNALKKCVGVRIAVLFQRKLCVPRMMQESQGNAQVVWRA